MKNAMLIPLLAFILSTCACGERGRSPFAANSDELSRAEFVVMISDYFDWVHWSEYNDYAKAVPRQFSDVKIGDKYVKQIECALEEKIISPDEDGKFYPDKPMTRQDAADLLALAFRIAPAPKDALTAFSDAGAVRADTRYALNALVSAGYMTGATANALKPNAGIKRLEAVAMLHKITSEQVAPVQVMPKPGTTSYRRNVNMTCPTPGATIYYTFTDDRTEPADPLTSGKIYDPSDGFLLFDNPNGSKTDSRYWRLKAVAVRDGLATSAVRSFAYYIARPLSAPFQARLVHPHTTTSPAVWDIFNPSDYNRPHVYYIEGTERGVVMDAGQYPAAKANLKTVVDTLATKPYDLVLGHNNPDHVEQINSFVEGGIKLFMTPQDKGSVAASKRADFVAAAATSVPIQDGDVLDLGNVQLTAYQTPGHSNGLVILQDKKNGWIFASDMFGCNRPATADITAFSGVKMDLFLSMVQQLYVNLRKNGGRIEEVYNAHNEVPLGCAALKNFEAAIQQLIDIGDSATVPSMRGTDPGGRPNNKRRTSIVGDMWRDKNWIALWIGGSWGGPVNYLTGANSDYKCNNKIDYNAPDGINKYSILSNIEIIDGELVGVDLTWAPPSNGVSNTLANKFDPWTYEYKIKVPAANESITIVPRAMSNRITSMTIGGVAIQSGKSKRTPVTDGTQVKIDIVAPDGVTKSQYLLTIETY